MKTKLITLLACSAVLALPLPASAASDYFLTFDGISGGSTDKAHKGAINVDSFSWGLSVPAINANGGGLGIGKPSFSDFSWTQSGADISFPTLFGDAAQGKHIKKAVLDLVDVGGKAPFSYLTMTFSDVFLTSLQFGGSSGNVPELNGSFAYGKVEMKAIPQKPDGSLGTPVIAGWDLGKNQIAGITAAVPEPGTYAMMLAGLGLVGFAVRRRAAAK